jgi:hypothetical protein
MVNINPVPANKVRRGRFSDRIEFRRGKQDALSGRAPASFAPQYVAGYAEGRRAQRSTPTVEAAGHDGDAAQPPSPGAARRAA